MDALRALPGLALGAPLARHLIVPRAVLGAVVVAVAAMVPSLSPPAVAACGAYFVAVTVTLGARLRSIPAARSRGPLLAAAVADAIGGMAIYALLSFNPYSPGVLVLPLVAFELALLGGARLAVAGGTVLVVSTAAHLAIRVMVFGLGPRALLLLVVVAVTAMLLGLAFALRHQEKGRRAAEDGRQRISDSLRATVAEVLRQVGSDRAGLSDEEIQALLASAAVPGDGGSELGRRLAGLLAPNRDDELLTPREREILQLMASGLPDADIARHLYVSRGTVRVHASNIVRKLGVSDRQEALRRFGDRCPGDPGAPGGAPGP